MSELFVQPEIFNMINTFLPTNYADQINTENHNIYTEIRKCSDTDIRSIFKEIRYIPLSSGILDYESDVWDFSQYVMIKTSNERLIFNDCALPYKDILKDYMLFLILNGNIKVLTLHNTCLKVRKFLNFLYDSGVSNLENIEESDVKAFFDSLADIALRTYTEYQSNIERFLKYYDIEYKTNILTSGIQNLVKKMSYSKRKAIMIENRRKAIPSEYFNKLLSILIRMMHDEQQTSYHRGLAAMLVIVSQIGIRSSELSLLEVDSIEEIDISGETTRMLNYKIIKTASGNNGYIEATTYVNDITYDAYKVAIESFAKWRHERNVNYLCCPARAVLPVRSSIYLNFLKRICAINYKELDGTNPAFNGVLSGSITKAQFLHNLGHDKEENFPTFKELSDNQTIYYPVVHQFRNTVITSLLQQGTDLQFVRQYMGHLCEEMTAAYAESYDTNMQENLAVSEEAISTIVTGEAKLLGSNAHRLLDGIDKWIQENNYNVANNLDEIIAGLEKMIPIRAKRGGVCIKGTKITNACSVDAPTDEFLCAVGLCPNICHFYYNADESYADYKEAMSTYTFNKENGFTRQAEKEFSKATFILRNRLGPEIIELTKELDKQGAQEILRKHPNLEDVLNNIEEIKEAIDEYIEEELN